MQDCSISSDPWYIPSFPLGQWHAGHSSGSGSRSVSVSSLSAKLTPSGAEAGAVFSNILHLFSNNQRDARMWMWISDRNPRPNPMIRTDGMPRILPPLGLGSGLWSLAFSPGFSARLGMLSREYWNVAHNCRRQWLIATTNRTDRPSHDVTAETSTRQAQPPGQLAVRQSPLHVCNRSKRVCKDKSRCMTAGIGRINR